MKYVIYSVFFADKLNTRTNRHLESCEGQLWCGAWQVAQIGASAAFVPEFLHNWTLPPWEYKHLISKQGWGTRTKCNLQMR